ncbi:MAG: DUF5696 domain-containing protein [Oscillospiraceae bacterium]|nr:DUF5696 domain-containing protein [Oscillospiraceae bacterium]
MAKKIKRFLMCLLAVSMLATAGTIHAAGDEEELSGDAASASDEEISDGESEEEEEEVKIAETVEDVTLTAADAERLLHKIGTVDGMDIYYKSKEYKDEVWALHGGNPDDTEDGDAEPTQEQLDAEADLDLLKPIGELVAIDSETGEAVASFDDYSETDSGRIYISDAERWLLYTDDELTSVSASREIISSIDDAYLFKTADGKTLELMDKYFSEVVGTYSYSSVMEDGKLLYKSTTDDSFAWVGENLDCVYGIFRYACENDSFRMLVDDRTAIIGLENKSNGYIWWSSPLDSTRDKIATPILRSELRSSSVLRYGVVDARSPHNYMRSNSSDCETKVSDISNGIKVTYTYPKVGISYPVEYTIEDDHLKASLRVSEITEKNSNDIATEITLLGSFGAAGINDEGYFVIPDGSGALVRFNNDRTFTGSYAQRVYGSDVTAVPNVKGAVTKQIYLPMYGIVNDDGNAMLVVASKGDSNAILNAEVSKQSNSSYNICNFTFMLRDIDTFYMSGKNKVELTVFEGGKIKSDDIEVRYYPIEEENADYVDIADKYRDYLLSEGGVAVKSEANNAPMYLDLYGGVEKKTPVLGIPVTMKKSITSFSQAKDIVTMLNESGVDNMVVSYNNWTSDGIKNQVDTGAKPSGTLGGKSDFSSFKTYIDNNGYELYPVSDNRDFTSGNGYYSFTSTSVRISGAYSRIISYDRAYGIPDGFKKNMSLLSPELFGEVFSEVAENYSGSGINGVSIGSLTSSLYGDYGKKNISRYNAMNMLAESYKTLNESLGNGILADSANAYAFPYVSHITGVPLSSSRYDMFDEDIPFYQIVMHGVIPYSTTALNGSADSETLLLMAAASGSNLSYDMLYEETSELKDTDFDIYYYANQSNWVNAAAEEYKLISSILSGVSDCTITDYVTDGDVITTTYSNGTVIEVDLENKTISADGTKYVLSEIAEKGGFTF